MGRRRSGSATLPIYDDIDENRFTLKLKHGGKILMSEPVTYVGGHVDYFDYMDVDEWGFMALQDTVIELGYTVSECKVYTVVGEGLIEVISDSEAWDLIDFSDKEREVEVWINIGGLNYEAETDVEVGEEYDYEAQVEVDVGEDPDYEAQGEVEVGEYSDYEAHGEVEVEEDPDYEDDGEEELRSLGEDDIHFEKAVDPNVEYHGLGPTTTVPDVKSENDKMNIQVNFSDDETPHGSDEEVEDDIWPKFRSCDMENPTFTIGMTFAEKKDFKDAIVSYAFKEGKDIKFEKNDKVRCIVKCKKIGCPWSITLRWIKDVNCWRVTSFNDTHDGCSWVWENSSVRSSRLAKRWKKDIGSNSTWRVSEFRERVATDDHFHITSKVAYKAMTMARADINGELEQYFKKFWNYYLEIERSNPRSRSIVKMSETVEAGGKSRFLRWYICWEACMKGFLHCRKIIGVDGCHLRSKYGGYLLTATAMDPNDGIFPLAYAIVEGENKQSWTWFLALLKFDLGIDEAHEHEYTFISDKQKGLLPAFSSELENVVHRFCVRHLYANMKVAGFHGNALKNALWSAARATTVNSFKESMRKIKDLDIDAFAWLGDKHPSEWSRSHFTGSALCDMLVNNVSECFNAMIVKAREMPLISCLEMLRTILMTRFFKNKEEASGWTSVICPNIVKKIAEEEKYAGGYIPIQCGLNLFEVKRLHTGEQHKVDLARRTCSCRKWELTGLPCRHGICAIWMKRHNVLDYVHNCYSVETYLKVYELGINPMAGPKEWPHSHLEPPLPPEYKSKPGRPRKLRLRGADEDKGKKKITNDGRP
ncbi:PREDICTED: uncharacterized protein LOC109149253 [Ipomoea nil]|uniref:uncharacterized protein LOC109149253 n=1 Tax=Ipomoea nil TaxID=35883 RepID=UPI000900BA85|nr:PREDICTED: uncharacterized protein LOC109149253 [Ipomoea nil]